MKDANYPLFPTFAFLGFVLALVPFPWHLQAWNAGTCSYMIWASASCLVLFINSVAWSGTAVNFAPLWCDISTKFLIGAGVGIPASSLCIVRRLYNIASIQSVTITRQDKRRGVIVDLSITVGLPVLVMILHVCVQGHRFNILENFGCFPEVVNTALAYPIVFMWPVLLGLISFVYAGLSLVAFWKRRAQFNDMLSKTSSMTVSRYMRMMILSCCEMVCTIPLGAYGMYINTHGVELIPYVSWADMHFDFNRAELIPAVEWKSNHSFEVSVELNRWIYPACALLFFALFGFADEAKRHYRLAFCWIAGRFGFNPSNTTAVGSYSFKINHPKPPALSSLGSIPGSLVESPEKIPHSFLTSSVSTMIDVDIEKHAGLSSPSDSEISSQDQFPHIIISEIPPSPASSSHSTESHSSDTAVSHDYISISEPYPASRPMSPNTSTESHTNHPYHRPLSLSTPYPTALPRGTGSPQPS